MTAYSFAQKISGLHKCLTSMSDFVRSWFFSEKWNLFLELNIIFSNFDQEAANLKQQIATRFQEILVFS